MRAASLLLAILLPLGGCAAGPGAVPHRPAAEAPRTPSAPREAVSVETSSAGTASAKSRPPAQPSTAPADASAVCEAADDLVRDVIDAQAVGRAGPMPRWVHLADAPGEPVPAGAIRVSVGPDWVAVDGFRGRTDADATPAAVGERVATLVDRRRRLAGQTDVPVVVHADRTVRLAELAPLLAAMATSGTPRLVFAAPERATTEPPTIAGAPDWYPAWRDRWLATEGHRGRLHLLQRAWVRLLEGHANVAVLDSLAAARAAARWTVFRSLFREERTRASLCTLATDPLFEILVVLSGEMYLGPHARTRAVLFGAPGEVRPRKTEAGPLTEDRTVGELAAALGPLPDDAPIVLARGWADHDD